ncbi:MAG TPA: ROK family transcriptional regulator [Phycisphaerales bacterium]|nr:ROK family transcriptional regulator [Phycisphaerales bacterium]
MKNSPIDSKNAGQRNENLILSMLFEHEKLSQAQLCNLAEIGSSTASTIVTRLRDKGFITETPGQSATRGPKPVVLELNPDCRYTVGVEINPSHLFIGLFNFKSQMKDKIRISLGSDHSLENVLDQLSVNVPGLLNRNKIEHTKVIGVGITLSGSVSPDGCVSLSSPLGWKNVHLKKHLQPFFDFPVSVYSNRVRLLSEFAISADLASKNILYLNLADGVGSTVYMDGNLISGATGRYGEIGHIVVEPDGPLCGCGQKGCLEALISGPALTNKIRNESGKIPSSCFPVTDSSDIPEEFLKQWSKSADDGDSYALALRDYVAGYFARATCMLINCYDPEVIVLAGYVSLHFHEYFAERIRDTMQTNVYEYSLRKIQIIPARAGENALITGVSIATRQRLLGWLV